MVDIKQELTGTALNEFLLKRAGQTWDEVIEPRATFADIDDEAFRMYLQMAQEKGRLPDVAGLTTEQIFEKLRLTENGQLKRALLCLVKTLFAFIRALLCKWVVLAKTIQNCAFRK